MWVGHRRQRLADQQQARAGRGVGITVRRARCAIGQHGSRIIGGNAIPGITCFTRAGLARGGHPAVNRLIEDRNHRGQVVGSVAYVHAVDSPAGLDQSLGRPVEQRAVAVVAGAGHQQYAAVLLAGFDDVLLPRGDADFDGRFHRAPSFHGCVLRVP